MSRIIMIAVVILAVAGGASGADENMVLPGKQAGDVKFPHQQHMERLNSCQPCHSANEGGKIDDFGKDTAHKLCKDCHVNKKSGPTNCSECHKQ